MLNFNIIFRYLYIYIIQPIQSIVNPMYKRDTKGLLVCANVMIKKMIPCHIFKKTCTPKRGAGFSVRFKRAQQRGYLLFFCSDDL